MLPPFQLDGNLPEGIWRATMEEVVARFGSGTPQRDEVTQRLLRIFELAAGTTHLERFIVFGSYITAKPSPNDVDVFLVMSRDFEMDNYIGFTRQLFVHGQADQTFGASIFWVTEKLPVEWIENLVDGWQNTRETTRRGIVEVTP